MRPRRIRRGRVEDERYLGSQVPRFNEAPANSPGKARRGTEHNQERPTCFNEAPANSPGKGIRVARCAELR